MTRYYISITDPFTPENALASYSSEAAALRAKGVLKLEIYSGFYDEEWGLQSKEDRLEKADAVEVYEVIHFCPPDVRSECLAVLI